MLAKRSNFGNISQLSYVYGVVQILHLTPDGSKKRTKHIGFHYAGYFTPMEDELQSGVWQQLFFPLSSFISIFMVELVGIAV